MNRLIAIWLLLATLGWAGAARAQTVDLVWIAPETCPDATEVREELAQLLGRPLDAPSEQLLTVRAVVTRAATNWQVQVEVGGAGGPQERTVQGATCREVTAAAVLVVGLAVDSGSQGERSEPSPEVAAAEPSPAPGTDTSTSGSVPEASDSDRPRAPSPPSSDAHDQERNLEVVLSAFGLIDARALPTPAPGLGLAVGLQWPSVRLGAAGAYFPAQRAVLADRSGGDFELSLAMLQGCYLPVRAAVWTLVCASVETGTLRGEGVNVASSKAATSPWWATGLGVHLVWYLFPSLALTTGGDVLTSLSRDEFVVARVGSVYRAPVITARWRLGIEARF